MTTLDAAVFIFGVLVAALAAAGMILVFYGHAFLDQARREEPKLSPGMKRLATLLSEEPP